MKMGGSWNAERSTSFIFHPARWAFQQPHKHSYSLQRISSKYHGHIQALPGHLKGTASHIKVTHPPCLFQLPPWENVNRSTTPIHCMWVTSSH